MARKRGARETTTTRPRRRRKKTRTTGWGQKRRKSEKPGRREKRRRSELTKKNYARTKNGKRSWKKCRSEVSSGVYVVIACECLSYLSL